MCLTYVSHARDGVWFALRGVHYCALTFKHAVEFSSFGCAPRFGFHRRLGQLVLLYLARFPVSNRASGPSPTRDAARNLTGSGMSAHRIRASHWWFGVPIRPFQTLVCLVRVTGSAR